MKTFLEHETVPNFVKWLSIELKQINKKVMLDHVIYNNYLVVMIARLKQPDGLVIPDINASFSLKQVSDRVKLIVSYHPALAKEIEFILQHLAEDYPETLADIRKKESSKEPWEKIEDRTGWDRTLVKMWWAGNNRKEIADRVNLSPDRVTNRISELRREYGEEIIPNNLARKNKLIKSRDTT